MTLQAENSGLKKNLKIYMALGVFALAAIAAQFYFSGSVNGSEKGAEAAWNKRCDKSHKICEITQSVIVKESGARIMEFTIGYPEDANGEARGIMLLPLGILVDRQLMLKIDTGNNYAFNVRQCTKSGCFAYIDVKDELLSAMRKGNKLKISFVTMQGQNVLMELSLKGFTKALKSIR